MRKPINADRITLFDRFALAVAGAVLGFLSGLALGWTLFFFLGAKVGLFGPTTATGKLFFYQMPLTVSLISAAGFIFFPKKFGGLLATIWHLIVGLSRD
jgi:hypothetical protein